VNERTGGTFSRSNDQLISSRPASSLFASAGGQRIDPGDLIVADGDGAIEDSLRGLFNRGA
jgi:hypothetical protein